MKIAIVDDDTRWIQTECDILNAFLQTQGITAEYSCCQSSSKFLALENTPFDLAFLDIEMDGENGISFARKLNVSNKQCQIVFVTNYLHYASDVYETDHVYFVLKEQFQMRLPEIFEKIQKKRQMGRSLITLSLIHAGEIILPAEEILCFERHLRKTIVRTQKGDYEVHEKLDDILLKLPKPLFVRCHNSYIVSMSQVRIMNSTEFLMKNGSTLPISRQYANHVKEQFLEWSALFI